MPPLALGHAHRGGGQGLWRSETPAITFSLVSFFPGSLWRAVRTVGLQFQLGAVAPLKAVFGESQSVLWAVPV